MKYFTIAIAFYSIVNAIPTDENLFKRATCAASGMASNSWDVVNNFDAFKKKVQSDLDTIKNAPYSCPGGKLFKRGLNGFFKCFAPAPAPVPQPPQPQQFLTPDLRTTFKETGQMFGYSDSFLASAPDSVLYAIYKELELYDIELKCNGAGQDLLYAIKAIHKLDGDNTPMTTSTFGPKTKQRLDLIQSIISKFPGVDTLELKAGVATSDLTGMANSIVKSKNGDITFLNVPPADQDFIEKAYATAREQVKASLNMINTNQLKPGKWVMFSDKQAATIKAIYEKINGVTHVQIANVKVIADNINAKTNSNSGANALITINAKTRVFYSSPPHAAITLVHEMSHFFGTEDHGYGEQWCEDAAKNKPLEAANNADCYGIFSYYMLHLQNEKCQLP